MKSKTPTKMKKGNKYPTMRCNHIINCPHYKGDGYVYRFNCIEFNFCESCNERLRNQMFEQFKLERSLIE
jgi:hypothetical protein